MDILYQNDEFCMEFSAEEIETEFIDKLKSDFNVDMQIDYEGPNNSIDYISIEPEKDNLAIRFYGFETAVYVFDEKIMLVDDNQLEKYTFSHIYDNVIYTGKLRILTHAEILSLLSDLVKCFVKCTGIKVEKSEPRALDSESCVKKDYVLSVTTTDTKIKSQIFSNIRINFIS